MKIGLIGYPNAGKKTLFKLLSGVDPLTLKDTPIGICRVRDPRLDTLSKMYNPKKTTPATFECVLVPDMSEDSEKNRAFLAALEKVDAICHVVRAFEEDSVYHLKGSVDAARDIRAIDSELLLSDLIFVEKRLERLDKEMVRNNSPERKKEQALLLSMQAHLEAEKPLRDYNFDDAGLKQTGSYPLLTNKPVVLTLNLGEASVKDTSLNADVRVSAKIEAELEEIEDPEERAAFLEDLGIQQSALEQLTQANYSALGLISFFTVGEDEVRAWQIRRGSMAPQAGAAIHSDIERGFIRAEHMRYEDLVEAGSEAALKEAGKWNLKGKDYEVLDGDVLSFRFNV
ncbi:MAG: redox-regulated ATPase YchF [Candidatus Omnitrophica bacterium]|nr:redox-regulated ATPase YchF [Candidatus Omnitrophota bacterium]